MEEIKMKAKTTKTNKSEQLINSMPIIIFILLAVTMNLYSNFSESNNRITEKQNMSFIIPMKGLCSANQVNQNLETDKLIELNKDVINLNLNLEKEFAKNSKSKSQNAEFKLLAEKLSVYLVLEDEPELELILLPISEKQLPANIYIKNEYLENLREVKVAELEKFYEIQQKCREYLAIEIEPTLELEDWMCDEKCWCFGNNTVFALNDK